MPATLIDMSRTVVIAGASVAALLVAIVILLSVLVIQNARAAEAARYERARLICESTIGAPSMDNLDEYAECSNRLLDR